MGSIIIEGVLADIDGVRHGQVAIEEGVIDAVGSGLGKADHVFPESCLIFAGMGDIHIHAREDVTAHKITRRRLPPRRRRLCTAASSTSPTCRTTRRRHRRRQLCRQGATAGEADLPVVFTLYAGIGSGTLPLTRTVPYKAYMGPSVGELFFSSLEDLDRTLAGYRGRAVSFHCEDPILLEQHKRAALHEDRRPPACELGATRFALTMIEKYGLIGKLCHYSVGEGLPLIRQAKARGLPVTAEVTPHHVFFDTTMITPANRPWMQMNPHYEALPIARPCSKHCAMEPATTSPRTTRRTQWPRKTRHVRPTTSGHLRPVRHLAPGQARFHAAASRGDLLGQPGDLRQRLSTGEVWPIVAGLCRVFDGAGFAGNPRRSAAPTCERAAVGVLSKA